MYIRLSQYTTCDNGNKIGIILESHSVANYVCNYELFFSECEAVLLVGSEFLSFTGLVAVLQAQLWCGVFCVSASAQRRARISVQDLIVRVLSLGIRVDIHYPIIISPAML